MRAVILISTIMFFIFSCTRNQTPLEPDNFFQEITHFQNEQGLVYELISRADSFPLYENVHLSLKLRNHSDTTVFNLTIPEQASFPLEVYDTQHNVVFSNVQQMKFIKEVSLQPGDSITLTLYWHQYETNSGLKVFAGTYFIKPLWIGVPSAPLGKWITITDKGDPLSAVLEPISASDDSLKLDFLLRNRIAKDLSFTLKETTPVEIQFHDAVYDVKVLSVFPAVNKQTVLLKGKSTANVFQYRAAKSDSVFNDYHGPYQCLIILNFESRKVAASTRVNFP